MVGSPILLRRLLKKIGSFENRPAAIVAAVSATLVGVFLHFSPVGDPLARLSFDLPFLFCPSVPTNDVVIVAMDESTFGDPELNKKYRYPDFDRATQARFLNKLASDGARLVVFDIFFKGDTPEDQAFAAAITNYGRVVLGADLEKLPSPEFLGRTLHEPASALRNLTGCSLGLVEVQRDEDDILREFPIERSMAPSLPFAAAEALGITNAISDRTRYLGFYGGREALNYVSYRFAIDKGPGFFKDKIVFIGGKPKVEILGASADFFSTPFTRWSRPHSRTPGVEIHATMFLNLIRHEWLNRMPLPLELSVVFLSGLVFGLLLSRFRPGAGLGWAALAVALISLAAIALFWGARSWFNWTMIAGVQVPVAWGSAAIAYSRKLFREKQTLQKELDTMKSGKPEPAVPPVLPAPVFGNFNESPPSDGELHIRDYELLQSVGEGAYGKVWLARSVIGAYRAIKVIYRKNFSEQRPFEREFEGVRNFEPISRTHPGWVSILHVGKDEPAGFFYYVMEPADDLALGRNINPVNYTPKTLGKVLVEKPWLTVAECLAIGAPLADALDALHKLSLVHRDVKPSNIIFCNDAPKLADIGLVAKTEDAKSFLGTVGFIPPEGPGTPQADIFSLGRVLYQAATGCEPNRHPGLPTALGDRTDARELMLLMDIINKACAHFQAKRYQSAADLRDDLLKLQASLSKRHVKS